MCIRDRPRAERVLLIQASLVMSAVTTLLELFPIGGKFGAGLPVMFGVSFAYLPSMQSCAEFAPDGEQDVYKRQAPG